MGYVEYRSNKSGGDWWLDDDQWRALEKAGWVVQWETLKPKYVDGGYVIDPKTGAPTLIQRGQGDLKSACLSEDGRFLGALATKAFRPGLSLMEAVKEWEKVTGENSTDAGCACCGVPHNFTEYDKDGKYVASGPESSYSASR